MTRTPIDFEALDGWQTLTEAVFRDPGPDPATAIIYLETGRDAVRISRGEFRETVRRYAQALQAQGIRRGDLVLMAHDDTLVLTFCFWGLVSIGAIPSIYTIPNERLFPEVYMANVAHLVKDIDARYLLTMEQLAQDFAGKMPFPVISLGKVLAALPAQADPDFAPCPSGPEDLAYIQTSSGTTGNQRCVPTTHRMLMKQLAMFARRMEMIREDVVVNWMPLYHDGGLIFGAVLPIVCRVPVALMSPLDWVRHPGIMFKAIHDFRGTLGNMPNFAFNHLVRRVRERDAEGLSLKSMRAFVNGSERVYHTSFDNFLERFAPLGVTPDRFGVAYGLAENTLMVTHTLIGRPMVYDSVDRKKLELDQVAENVPRDHPDAAINVSCGPPLEGVDVRILGDADQSLPERRVGQVAIRSASLFTGYYRHPELSDHLFRDGWFLTGDMGYMAAGELFIVGRLKDLIINGGKNVYPADIEEIIGAIPGVRPGRVVAFGVPDEVEGTELIAVVAEVEPAEPEKKAEIDRLLRRAVTQQMSLTVNFVDVINDRWIIKTSSGKTSRTANRRKWLEAKGANLGGPLAG